MDFNGQADSFLHEPNSQRSSGQGLEEDTIVEIDALITSNFRHVLAW